MGEHTHNDLEFRHIVSGEATFFIRIDDTIYTIRCVANDIISIPANTRHWFKTDVLPVIADRYFTHPEGWVADYIDTKYKW